MAEYRAGTYDGARRAAEGEEDPRPSESIVSREGPLKLVHRYHDPLKFVGLHEWDVQCKFNQSPSVAELELDSSPQPR